MGTGVFETQLNLSFFFVIQAQLFLKHTDEVILSFLHPKCCHFGHFDQLTLCNWLHWLTSLQADWLLKQVTPYVVKSATGDATRRLELSWDGQFTLLQLRCKLSLGRVTCDSCACTYAVIKPCGWFTEIRVATVLLGGITFLEKKQNRHSKTALSDKNIYSVFYSTL